MTLDEQEVYNFIQAMQAEFGKCEFIAKGSLGAVVKTPNYQHKRYTEIIPYVKPKEKVKNKLK